MHAHPHRERIRQEAIKQLLFSFNAARGGEKLLYFIGVPSVNL